MTIVISVLDGVTENMGDGRGVKREVRTTWVQGFEILVISGGTVFALLGRLGGGFSLMTRLEGHQSWVFLFILFFRLLLIWVC